MKINFARHQHDTERTQNRAAGIVAADSFFALFGARQLLSSFGVVICTSYDQHCSILLAEFSNIVSMYLQRYFRYKNIQKSLEKYSKKSRASPIIIKERYTNNYLKFCYFSFIFPFFQVKGWCTSLLYSKRYHRVSYISSNSFGEELHISRERLPAVFRPSSA